VKRLNISRSRAVENKQRRQDSDMFKENIYVIANRLPMQIEFATLALNYCITLPDQI
jgi:hypothetical protein